MGLSKSFAPLKGIPNEKFGDDKKRVYQLDPTPIVGVIGGPIMSPISVPP